MTALSQHGRLATLQTALGTDGLVVHEATVWEAIGPCPDRALAAPARWLHTLPGDGGEAERPTGFRIELVALAADRSLALASLHGTPARLDLQTATGRRCWHGHLHEAGWLGDDGGLARVRLLIEPWTAWLQDEQHAEVFHDASVVEIVDRVLGRTRAGAPEPAWRWDLADGAALARRGRCVQAHESDLAFIERLLLDEGLCHWFEHEADAEAPGGGRHRLVIADHAGAFSSSAVPTLRYAPGGTGPQEDTLARWSREHRLVTRRLRWASRDDRRADLRPVAAGPEALPALESVDVADGYAYPSLEHGLHRAATRLDALARDAQRCRASGGWRDAAAGLCFTLTGHPVHDGSDPARDRFVVDVVRHELRNDIAAGPLKHGALAAEPGPGHRCELIARPAALAPRPLPRDEQARPELRLAPAADAHGLGSTRIVGDGAPVTTDRDHRVLLRFHWEHGDGGEPTPSPHAATAGRWVRVATPVAGDGWGGVHPPRAGQEALVAFVAGRHDRPLVLGTLYGSAGHDGEVPVAATTASPPWRPDPADGSPPPGPALGAQLSGWRTRELAATGAAAGRGNQLVFDDSPGAERVELASDESATRLQLGHLREQQDGRPLAPRGAGLDLQTAAWGALRAGSGLLLSAHGRPGSQHEGLQLDTTEAQARLQQARRVASTAVGSAWPVLDALAERLAADARGTGWSRPDLLLAAPQGVVFSTSGDQVQACDGDHEQVASALQQLAGRTLAFVAGGGLQLHAGGGGDTAGLSVMCLHAADGPASVQAGGAATVQARQDLRVASCDATLDVLGATAIRLETGGASLRLDAEGITLSARGTVQLAGGPVRLEAGRSADTGAAPR